MAAASLTESARLARDPTTEDLSRRLVDRNLADPLVSRVGKDWLRVDKRIAGLYMAYLARCLGTVLHMEPITDQPRTFASVVNPAASLDHQVDRMRGAVLGSVLPAPARRVTPREIAEFKERHWDELRTFRLHVEKALLDTLAAPTTELRDRRLRHASESLQAEVEEVEALMRPKWPTARGLLCAALAAAPAAVKLSATGDPTEGGGVAAPLVVEVVDSLLGRTHSGSPVAYATLARGAFGG